MSSQQMPSLLKSNISLGALKNAKLSDLKGAKLPLPHGAQGFLTGNVTLRPHRRVVTVGLDIQPGYVAAAQVHRNGRIVVERAAAVSLAADTVREGEVLDPEALTAALREVFANSDLPRHVRVGVANQRTVMRMLEVPPLSDAKDLDTAVRFQAEDQVPMPLSNAVLDYRALGIVDTPAGARQRVLLVAAQRDMVEKLLGAVRAAGLHPEGIDLSAFALIRSLHSSIGATDSLAPGEARPPVLHLNVGGLTNMAIAEDTDCRFTRVLARGLEAIAADVAERRGVPVDQARELLRRIDLAPSTSARDELGPAGIESSSAAGLGGAHGPTVAGPAAELRTSSEPNGDGSMQAAAAPSMAVADEDTVTGPRSQTAGNGDGVAESQADQPGPSADQPGPAADQPGPAADQPGPSAIGGQPPESRIAGADADPQSATAEAAGPASRRRPPVDEFADVRPILESGVRGIASEVRNSLDFYQAQEHGPTVSMVLLSGPALDIPGFAAMLELNLGLRVHAESVAAADDSVLNGISVQYLAIAAGLAVEDVAS